MADTREHPAGLEQLSERIPGVEIKTGGLPLTLLEGCNLLVFSPGLSPEHSAATPLTAAARAAGIDIVGEIELFARELNRLKATTGYAPQVLAITGTNGKTTTTTITGLMAKAAGKSVCVAGNIGPNALRELKKAEDTGELPQVWVLELSSFQLETTKNLFLTAAAFLNLTEDHIDWHGSLENYAAAKGSIFRHAENKILNRGDDAVMKNAAGSVPVRTFGLTSPAEPGEWGVTTDAGVEWLSVIPCREGEEARTKKALLAAGDAPQLTLLMPSKALKIRGRHNVMNALAALALADAAPVQDFKGVVQHGLVHHGVDEFEVFFLRPEQHFLRLLAAHISGLCSGIDLQAVILDGVVENTAQLGMDVLEIVRGIAFAA